MKKLILLLTLIMASTSFAQLNFKAVAWSGIITDDAGSPLANTDIILKFTYTDNGTTVFFIEEHNKTTDDNGFVTANIGTGTIIQNGSSLLYMAQNLKLKIEVNSGSGFVVLMDDYLTAVPYAQGALYAGTLTDNYNSVTLDYFNGRIHIDPSQEIWFFSNGNYQGEINSNGLLLNDLAGTGVREIVADANGQLERKPIITKHLAISGAAFSNTEFIFIPTYSTLLRANQLSQNAADLSLNVNLPSNAKITGLKVIYLDNSITRGFNLGLYHTNTSNTSTFIVGFNTDTTSPSAAFQTWNSPALNHTVDNFNNSYYITVNSNDWQTGLELGLLKIVITYEE